VAAKGGGPIAKPGMLLDSPAQILAWALVFACAQQLLTRFVDHQATGNEESLAAAPVAVAVDRPVTREYGRPHDGDHA
jgi:hypothetical protein